MYAHVEDRKQENAPARSHTHNECVRGLTFDPVPLIKADLSLPLRRVRARGDKHSSGDGAVETPPLSRRLSGGARWGRPGGQLRHRVHILLSSLVAVVVADRLTVYFICISFGNCNDMLITMSLTSDRK